MNDLIQNLDAAGLSPIIIDESTDMATLPTLNTTATPTPASADTLMVAAKLVAKTVAKIAATDSLLEDQWVLVQGAKEKVAAALTGEGNFDDAGRAFKAASNKYDKLLESREALVRNANADLAAVREQTIAAQALLDNLDA